MRGVSHWLKEATKKVPSVSKRSSKGVPSGSERSSKRGSKSQSIDTTELRSVSSSVRSEVSRSKVKVDSLVLQRSRKKRSCSRHPKEYERKL